MDSELFRFAKPECDVSLTQACLRTDRQMATMRREGRASALWWLQCVRRIPILLIRGDSRVASQECCRTSMNSDTCLLSIARSSFSPLISALIPNSLHPLQRLPEHNSNDCRRGETGAICVGSMSRVRWRYHGSFDQSQHMRVGAIGDNRGEVGKEAKPPFFARLSLDDSISSF